MITSHYSCLLFASLSLVLSHVFQNKGTDCDDVTMLRTLRLALTRFLTPPISCSVVQGLAFLSNPWPSFAISCHITSPLNVVPTLHPFCSLKLITNSSNQRAFACTIPFYQNAIPASLLSSVFAQLTSTWPSNFSSVVLSLWTPLLTANPGPDCFVTCSREPCAFYYLSLK